MPLAAPPRDDDNEVSPHDHPEIYDHDKLIRRISEQYLVPDEKALTGRRVSSMALSTSSDGHRSMSVDIEKLIVEANLIPQIYVTNPIFTGSVWFVAKNPRDEGLIVGFDPLEENPYHGGVWGNLSKSCRKRLWKQVEWYVEIPNTDLKV